MTRRYRLRPRWGVMALAILFFAGCTAVIGYKAATTERGLVINGLVELGPAGARIVWGVLTLLSAAFVIVGVAGTLRLARGTHEIVIDDTTITIPPPVFHKRPTTIAFTDIRRTVRQRVHGQEFFTLEHAAGTSWIHRQALGDAAFAEIMAHLETRLARG